MVRFHGHGVPKDCEILHLPQLKQNNTCFLEKKRRKKNKTRRRDIRVGRVWELLNRDIDKIILLWEFGWCPSRQQNHYWMCVSLQRGGQIGCKASQVRVRSDGLNCPPNHPRLPPYRDFDASCETRWLRARKSLTPWPEGWVFVQSPVLQDVSEQPWSFWFGQASSSGRWGMQPQCTIRQHCGSWMAGQRLWRTQRACTTTVAQVYTWWQIRGAVSWFGLSLIPAQCV